jgi:hypothetical protein
MNRPIDGIDLDGLEFYDADEAMVDLTLSGPVLRLDNISNSTWHAIHQAGNYSTPEEIGPNFNMRIYEFSKKPPTFQSGIARDGMAGPLRTGEFSTRIQIAEQSIANGDFLRYNSRTGSNARTRRNADRRFERIKQSPVGKGSKSAGAAIIVGGVIKGLDWIHGNNRDADWGEAVNQWSDHGVLSMKIVLDNIDLVPEELKSMKNLTSLSNFVLNGTVPSTLDEGVRGMFFDTGVRIIARDERVPLTNKNLNDHIDYIKKKYNVKHDKKKD